MANIGKDTVLNYRGQDLYDRDGGKIGSVEEIYLDAETDEPEWALVHTGLFGTKRTFVPLREATETGGNLTVPYDKSTVKDAPQVEANGQLSQREEGELYRHYGMEYSELQSDTGLGESTGTGAATGLVDTDRNRTESFENRPPVGDDVSGPETDNAMTRSEEELRVGTTQRESGRARLKKYIVTENVTQTVPVRREEVRLEREPITDANIDSATSGPDLSEEEHEVVLHQEEVVADKRVVPKERVRLDKDVEVTEETVNEEVRREEVEIEGDATTRTRGATDLDDDIRRDERL
jgi:uncharacterized protein (TIGR02271 family)